MATQILVGTTAAAISKPFIVRTDATCGLIAVGMGAIDSIPIEVQSDPNVWVDTLVALTLGNPTRPIVAPGTYRLNKGVTTGSPNIYVSTEADA